MITAVMFVGLFFTYALLSRRLSETPITAPILFTGAGMLVSPSWVHIVGAGVTASVFLRVAEIGLVLLLFTDASRTELAVCEKSGPF